MNPIHPAEADATQTRQFCRVRRGSILKYTHTHTRLTALFPRLHISALEVFLNDMRYINPRFTYLLTYLLTTRASRYQKGKTNLDFTEARDSEWQWHQLGRMQVCTSLQTDNHASTPPLSFYRPDALPAAQPTASKH